MTYEMLYSADPVDAVTSGSYGDNAVGMAYETVLRKKLDSGVYESLTFSYFVETCKTTNQPEVRDSHIVMERIETLRHTDPDDPGGSEVFCDYEYDDGSVFFYDDLEAAEAEAKRCAVSITPDLFNNDEGGK